MAKGGTVEGSLFAHALAYHRAGISLIPILDGTKVPASHLLPMGDDDRRTWKPYQQAAPDEETLEGWFGAGGARGLAAVCGRVSDGLLAIDFDDSRLYEHWRVAVGSLADGLPVQRTGGGGYHVLLRCPDPG